MNIISQKFVPKFKVASAVPHPRNAREHAQDSIDNSIDSLGFYGAIIIHKATGQVLAGHGRLAKAQADEAVHIPALIVDVDQATADRILLADNRTNDLAGYNDQALVDLLQHVSTEHGDLEGTGYEADDMDRLLADLEAGRKQKETAGHPQGDDSYERYEATDMRQINLLMTVPEYDTVLDQMESIIDEVDGVESNFDVVRHCINFYLEKRDF